MVRSQLLASALLVAVASAQLSLTSLPACAQSCTILLQAQASCNAVPSTAQSCFCQSSLLAPIKSSPSSNQCVSSSCSAAEWQQVVNWYNGQCANGGTGTTAAGASTLSTAVASAASGAASAASSAIAVANGGSAATSAPVSSGAGAQQTQSSGTFSTASGTDTSANAAANYTNGSEWWSTHYQWIIMLIVLLVVFVAAGVIGSILYKRHKRRTARGSMSGRAQSWAPNSSPHDLDVQGRQALATAGPVTDEKTEGPRKTKSLTKNLR